MARIKKVGYFDILRLKKKISFLSTNVLKHYTKVFMNFPLGVFHEFLPIKFKFLPESYIIQENKEILGLITISPTPGNPYRLVITRFFLEQDCFNEGKQLIDFVIAKYGAKGATSFISTVDDSYDELLYLFADECGFRQCSSEQLWKLEEIRFSNASEVFIRPFKNSDAKAAAECFNDSVITHFKYSISKSKEEYSEPLFSGLSEHYKLRFVLEDENRKSINAFFSIKTADNSNYILNITNSGWCECPYEEILKFSVNQISRRSKKFNLFVKLNNYTSTAELLETYLKSIGAKCFQNQLILVKDFHRVVKDPEFSNKIALFSSIYEKPVFKI